MSASPESKLYLELCQAVAKARSVFAARHQDRIKLPEDATQKEAGARKPFLDIQKFDTEKRLLEKFLDDLVGLLERYEVFDRREIEKLGAIKENTRVQELMRAVLATDSKGLRQLSTQIDVEMDLLLLVGLNLTQAVLELYAKKLRPKVDQKNWLKGICPICGGHPAIEKLRREDGSRMLHCSLCGTEWHFKRIMCPFCGNEDHNSLRYFFVEEDSPFGSDAFRVDVCDKCKMYIKTLDERKLAENQKPDLYLQNLNTLYLDILAQRDGYQSPTYWMIAPSEDLFA
ncbi:MAG: formate dehydrogenase accessory protein FdhE [candidate division Zixibacteria bacterium]|nr:formate dehydrogenase accessory protein FdhE [candidate division Zixibacteria bacterium]